MRHLSDTEWFKWLHLALTGMVMPAIWILHGASTDHERRLSAVEQHQKVDFVAADGLEVWKEIGRIRENMAQLPAPEFRAKVDRIEASLNEMNRRMARVETLLEQQGRN